MRQLYLDRDCGCLMRSCRLFIYCCVNVLRQQTRRCLYYGCLESDMCMCFWSEEECDVTQFAESICMLWCCQGIGDIQWISMEKADTVLFILTELFRIFGKVIFLDLKSMVYWWGLILILSCDWHQCLHTKEYVLMMMMVVSLVSIAFRWWRIYVDSMVQTTLCMEYSSMRWTIMVLCWNASGSVIMWYSRLVFNRLNWCYCCLF